LRACSHCVSFVDVFELGVSKRGVGGLNSESDKMEGKRF
jgi:hypothetical protein